MLDANLLLSGTVSAAGAVTGQAITATAASTNVIDLLTARDIAAGDDGIEVHVAVVEAFATLTSLQVVLQSSADNSAWVDILLSPVVLTANLGVGAKLFRVRMPVFNLNDVGSPNQYLRLNYVVAGSNATTGKIIAYLTPGGDRTVQYYYPNNFVTA